MRFLTKTNERNLPSRSRRLGDYDIFKSFDDFFNRRGEDIYDSDLSSFSPMVNIEETANAYLVEAEVPGVKKENIEVNIKDDYLVIKGEKKSFDEQKKEQYHRIERSHGNFYRTIALPSDIDKDQVDAELKDGLLLITIKKSPNQKAHEKKITIH